MRSFFTVMLLAMMVHTASAQNWTEVQKVLPPNDNSSPIGGQGDNFGRSVAVSGDLAAAGAPGADVTGPGSGTVFLYSRSGGAWSFDGQLNASDGVEEDGFGQMIAMNDSVMAVTALSASGNSAFSGVVYVYRRIGSEWIEEAKLQASNGSAYDQFGFSLDIFGDRILVGANFDDDNGNQSGSAYVFERVAGTWTEVAHLVPGDGAANDQFGFDVALSDSLAFIGAFAHDGFGNNRGGVYIYNHDGGAWNLMQKVIAPDAANGDNSGIAVDADGDYLAIGARNDDDNGGNSGSVNVFQLSGGSYVFQQKLLPSDGAALDEFGRIVQLSGNRIAVGVQGDDDQGVSSGSVYLFELGVNWTQVQKLIPADGSANDRFGLEVCLNGDDLVVGSRFDDDEGIDSGSAYFYSYDGSWSPVFKTSESDMIDDPTLDQFGSAVDLSWDNAVVASSRDGDFGALSGSVRFYGFDGSEWQDLGKVYADDASQSSVFGFEVSLSGDRAAISARSEDEIAQDAGAVYIFEKEDGQWLQTKKIKPFDGAAYDNFGWSVSLDEDQVAVGAYLDDDGSANSGSVYVYEYNGSNWPIKTKLIASDASSNDRFGFSVDIDNDLLVVGARNDSDEELNGGSAYVFQKIGGNWSEVAKLTPSDPTAQKLFGEEVSINDGVVMIGATGDAVGGANAGAVYVFQDQGGWTQTAKVKPNVVNEAMYFGSSIDNLGDEAIIGAYRARQDDNIRYGAAYIFKETAGVWNQVDSIWASDGESLDFFGIAAAYDGEKALIGAQNVDDSGVDAGAAYFFNNCIDSDDNGICDFQESPNALDVCDSAMYLTASLFGTPSWDTLGFYGATESIVGCAGDADDDIWFRFTAQQANDMVMAKDPAGLADIAVEIYTDCGSTLIGCFDNYGAEFNEAAIPGGLIPGDDYVFRVYDKASGYLPTSEVRVQVKTFAVGAIRSQYCGRMDYGLTSVITPQRQDLNQLYPYTTIPAKGYGIEFTEVATGYTFEVEQLGQTAPFFHFQQIPQLQLNTEYEIRAKHLLKIQANGGPGDFWSDYGPSCLIGIAGPEVTELLPWFCDNSPGYGFDDYIQAYPVTFADSYRFTLHDGTSSIVKTCPSYTLFLDDVPGLELGITYTVSVQSRVNGIWSDPGPSCNIHMMGLGLTVSLQDQYCDGTFEYPSAQYLLADFIPDADKYRWRFTPQGGGSPQYQTTNGLSLAFHWANSLSLQSGESYDVGVQCRINGEWTNFGDECTIHLVAPSSFDDPQKSSLVLMGEELSLIPNPSDGEFFVIYTSSEEVLTSYRLQVLDASGRLVYEEQIPAKGSELRARLDLRSVLEAGLYHIQFQGAEGMTSAKLIIE